MISWLVREEFWLRLIGGLLLIGIGIVYFFKHPKSLENGKESSHSAYVTALLLTLTNPTTVLSFLAVLAALGLSGQRPPLMTLILVGGIFTGSMLWWIILAIGANHFRDKVNDRVTALDEPDRGAGDRRLRIVDADSGEVYSFAPLIQSRMMAYSAESLAKRMPPPCASVPATPSVSELEVGFFRIRLFSGSAVSTTLSAVE